MINVQTSAFQNCWKQSDVWHQTRASRGMIVSICFPVGPVHRQGTFSEHSTTSDKGYRTLCVCVCILAPSF
jgi:hypothetical protein